jgi:hypothetical protein
LSPRLSGSGWGSRPRSTRRPAFQFQRREEVMQGHTHTHHTELNCERQLCAQFDSLGGQQSGRPAAGV